ncbi:MAG: adenylate/guanylate cyclase domain-containing protein, partial [Spirochaetota bacterium]
MQLDEASVQNRLSLDDVYKHSIEIAEKYKRAPDYVALYIRELLRNNHYLESDDKKVAELQKIIEDNQQRAEQGEQSQELEQIRSFVEERDAALELQRASEEISFRKRIEEYYLPKQLVNAIIEKGEIPTATAEQFVGIGFIDIADYTFLSKFLSPNENQTVLNGLYAAFNFVLNRHGGYLNKIEGDSLMFHFGGSLDPNVRELDREQQERYIARELFYTCVEM